jgi:predicted nucleotidyltransferase
MTRTSEHIEDFIDTLTSWASTQPDIMAVALVGSYAREAASETSDIDLVLLVNDPKVYLENTGWLKRFGPIEKQQTEDYGNVKSLRVWYDGGHEVEYGLTTRDWVQLPLDEGTWRVIKDGMGILLERETLLSPHLQD